MQKTRHRFPRRPAPVDGTVQVGDVEIGAPALHVWRVFNKEIVFPVITAVGPALPDPGGNVPVGQINPGGHQRIAVQVVPAFGDIAALPL